MQPRRRHAADTFCADGFDTAACYSTGSGAGRPGLDRCSIE
jgi:hypothetical protein